MKKFFTPILFFGLIFRSFAQPVLNDSYMPSVGKAFSGRSFTKTVPLPPIQTGANQTWDFTGLDSVYITDYSFAFRNKAVSSTDSGAFFPGAGSAYVSFFGTDSIENFQKVNGDDLEYLGYNVKGSPYNEKFSVPRVDFRKGLEFGETFIRQSRSILKIGSFRKYNRYHDTVTYAGYGTLITPFATYQNVVLLQRFFSVDVAFGPNDPLQLAYLGKNWLWYLPGYGVPYVKYSEEVDLFVPDQTLIEGFVGFIPVVATDKPKVREEVKIWPSETSGDTWIRISGVSDGSEVQVLDAIGRPVSRTTVSDQRFRIEGLPSGIYSVQVQNAGYPEFRRIVVR